MEQQIYQMSRYEHLRKKSQRQPIPLVIDGIFSLGVEDQLTTNLPELKKQTNENPKHPFLNINSDEVLGF